LTTPNGSTDEVPSLEWREIRFRWEDSKWISQEPYFSEVYDISEMLIRYLVHTKCKYNSTAIDLTIDMILYDIFYDNDSTSDSYDEVKSKVYRITIIISSELWSGRKFSDEIQIFLLEGNVIEWFDLDIWKHGDFKKLSMNAFCGKPIGQCKWSYKYGLREFPRNDIKIEAIMPSESFLSSAFNVREWIIESFCYICHKMFYLYDYIQPE